MRKFNPGDRVICIDQTAGLSKGDIYTIVGLSKGDIYTIVDCEDEDIYVPIVHLKEQTLCGFFTNRFELFNVIDEKVLEEKIEGWGF
jgi:hypothetical protein